MLFILQQRFSTWVILGSCDLYKEQTLICYACKHVEQAFIEGSLTHTNTLKMLLCHQREESYKYSKRQNTIVSESLFKKV